MNTAERQTQNMAFEDVPLGTIIGNSTTQDPGQNQEILQVEQEEEGESTNRFSKARHTILLVSIFMTLFLPALDQTIVSTALPKIIASLPTSRSLEGSGYTWVGSSYALASAAVMPFFGQVSEVYGRKWVFLAAIVIFMIGSCLCGASQDVAMLVASRSVQGVGAGGILALVMIIIGDLVGTR